MIPLDIQEVRGLINVSPKCINLEVYFVPFPHTGSNHLRPLLGPLSNMLQMLQECSQLELALRVLVNSYGSCLQHVTSNVMDLKISVQVWLVHVHWAQQGTCRMFLEQWNNYCRFCCFIVGIGWLFCNVCTEIVIVCNSSCSCMTQKSLRSTIHAWTISAKQLLRLCMLLLWPCWTRWVWWRMSWKLG